ncbi:hypothetical protein PYS47_17700 [Alicyclobacillus fastidiosus]|nr:hypothetical protein [Alicyclobacillus fastidiosus]WEH08507.1 hypothetical protein PYS47_17700 [Alicyclobacillus fastidiosus]
MASKTNHTEPGSWEVRYPDECWVKIPSKPTIDTMVGCLQSLISQLQKHDRQRALAGIKISPEDKTVRVRLKEQESSEKQDIRDKAS